MQVISEKSITTLSMTWWSEVLVLAMVMQLGNIMDCQIGTCPMLCCVEFTKCVNSSKWFTQCCPEWGHVPTLWSMGNTEWLTMFLKIFKFYTQSDIIGSQYQVDSLLTKC